MKHKSTKLILAALIGVFSLSALTAPAFAVDPCDSSLPSDVRAAAGCSGNTNALPTIITNILYSVIAVAGLVAVIFIIIGGVNYMTSSGDPGKTKKAKDTILYAMIGLVICVLAFAIVNWTIGAINGNSGGQATATTYCEGSTDCQRQCTGTGHYWHEGSSGYGSCTSQP